MTPDYWLPLPTDLEDAPSLAVLAVLQAALRVANTALVTDHPALLDSQLPDEPLDHAAAIVAARLGLLHRAIAAYRAAVERFANPR
jgi:hypothetical protein